MAQRAEDSKGYWENYTGFQSTIKAERDDAVATIDQKVRMGTLATEQRDAAVAALDAEMASDLEGLKSGATYELLQAEYEAQRDYVYSTAADWDKRNIEYREATPGEEGSQGGDFEWEGTPATAAGWYETGEAYNTGGDFNPEGDRDVTYTDFDPAKADRDAAANFAKSADEYFSQQFGVSDTAPRRGPQGARAGVGGSASSTASIGVGKTYSWY